MKKIIDRILYEFGNFIFYSLLSANIIRMICLLLPELIFCGILVWIGLKTKNKKLFKYGRNKALTIDQFINTEALGHPDETISSRLGRSYDIEKYTWTKLLRKFVDWAAKKYFDDEHHCLRSIIPLEQEQFKDLDYEIWSWNKEDTK